MKVNVEFADSVQVTGSAWLDVTFKGCLAFVVLENWSWQFKAFQDSASAEFWLDGESWVYLEHYTTYSSECARFGFSKGGKIYD